MVNYAFQNDRGYYVNITRGQFQALLTTARQLLHNLDMYQSYAARGGDAIADRRSESVGESLKFDRKCIVGHLLALMSLHLSQRLIILMASRVNVFYRQKENRHSPGHLNFLNTGTYFLGIPYYRSINYNTYYPEKNLIKIISFVTFTFNPF